jgi:crossover junction endodeoxyribonuclease RuvC
MRILGIDPGLRRTGYGLVEISARGPVLVEGGLIETDGRSPLPARLYELYSGLMDVVSDGHPEVIALEDLFAHAGFPRAGILMGHVCGIVCLAAEQAGVPVDAISPASVKRAIAASGSAGKRQIQRMVRHLLLLAEDPGTHVADALAIALTALSRRGLPLARPARVRGSA